MAPMRRLTSKMAPLEIMHLKNKGELDLKVTGADLENALKSTAPSVAQQSLAEYAKWNQEFASV